MGSCPLCDLELVDEQALGRHVEACLERISQKSPPENNNNNNNNDKKEDMEDLVVSSSSSCPVCHQTGMSAQQLEAHIDPCLVLLQNKQAQAQLPPAKKRTGFSDVCERFLGALDKGEKRGETGVPFTVARRIVFDLMAQHKRDMAVQAEQFLVVRLELESSIKTMRQAQDNELSELRVTEWKAQDDLAEQHDKKSQEWSSAAALKEQELDRLRRQSEELAQQMKELGDSSSSSVESLSEEETKALASDTFLRIKLTPSMIFGGHQSSREVMYRVCESQFLRLTRGSNYAITKVECCFGPRLIKRYQEFKDALKAAGKRVEEHLLFHCTSAAVIEKIVTQGFIIGGQADEYGNRAKFHIQAHGAGVYSSESPAFAMRYLRDGNKQMLMVKAVPSADSTIIMDATKTHIEQLVVKNVAQIVPMFIVHFT